MHPLLKNFFRMNWVLVGLIFALLTYGVYAIYSASAVHGQNFWRVQIVWALVSLPVFVAVSLIDYRWIRWGAVPIYIVSLMMLVAVMVVGVKRYGAKCWINLGFMSFQPAQFAIIGGILTIALFLERSRRLPSWLRVIACGVLVGAPWILIIIEPDLGMCIVWVPVVLAMMFIGGIPKRWLIVLILIGVAMVPIVVNFGLKPYQYARITSFINPDYDPRGDGWNIIQSLNAIGSGGMYGKGLNAPDSLNVLGYLPSTAVQNDFVFAVMGEQLGFVGGVILMGALCAVMLVGLYIALNAEDDLGKMVATGVVLLLFAHILMNIGMTIGVTPITGLPLPFISYGGTFLLSILFGMGLLQSVWIHRRQGREAH